MKLQNINTSIKKYTSKENSSIKNKINSLVSQLPGSVQNIDFSYNKNNKIAKATITVVVASQEEANKIKNSSDKIDIKVVIKKETSKDENTAQKKDKLKEESLIEPNEYSFTRGPEGKIYGIATKDKKEKNSKQLFSIKDNKKNSSLREKNIDLYKRYNFKSIETKELKKDQRFNFLI